MASGTGPRFMTLGVVAVGLLAYLGFQRLWARATGEVPSDLLAAALGLALGGGVALLLRRGTSGD